MFVMNGLVTGKFTVLLAVLLTVTTTPTVPAISPFGTTTMIEVLLQPVVDATVEPNLTVLEPLVAPKLLPVIVTEVPDGPEVGDKLEITMGFATVKVTLILLETPPTVTTTLAAPLATPEGTTATIDVLPQLVVEAVTPANVTVLLPLVPPKFLPVIVTEVPVGPEVGEMLVMLGAAANRMPLVRTTKARIEKALSTARRVERITLPPCH